MTPDQRLLGIIAKAVEYHSLCDCGDCSEDFGQHCAHVAVGVLEALRSEKVLVVDTSNWKSTTDRA